MLQPIHVIGDVLCVQSCIVVLHVVVIFQFTDDAAAQKLVSLGIGPVRVGIMAEEVGVELGIEFSDVRLGLAKLLHTAVVLGE